MSGINYTRLFNRTRDRPLSGLSSSSSHSRKQRLARFWPWLSLSFGVLWLVPAVSILALNFRDTIVGPSIGCLRSSSKCQLNLQTTAQIQQAKAFEKDNKEALVGLQLAAKALDAWFCFIAASLVWSMLKRLAGQDPTKSLPVGYLHLHTECSDLRVLYKLFWGRRRDAKRKVGASRIRLYYFIIFVACICVLCNLMGPATAVLVIPNLDWMDINKSPNVWFENVLSLSRPLPATIAPNLKASIAPSCSDTNLTDGMYSCTWKSLLATTDMVVASAVATNDQTYVTNGTGKIPFNALVLPPVLQESNVSFTVNFSDFTAWTASRQALRGLSADIWDYDNMTGGNPQLQKNDYPNSAFFNRSLQARLQRRGPILGQTNLCFTANDSDWKSFPVATGREVRCYKRFLLNHTSVWRCVPMGTRWTQFLTALSNFTVVDFSRNNTTPSYTASDGQRSNGNLTVTVHAANVSLDIGNSTLYTIGHDFDWTTAFSNPRLLDIIFTGPRQIFEYKRNVAIRGLAPNKTLTNWTRFVYCDSQTNLGLADYALNPSLLSNPIRLVETNVITSSSPDAPAPQPIFIHPDWTLAAWSVDRVDGRVAGKRGAARRTLVALEEWVSAALSSPANGENIQAAQDFRNIHKFMGAQTVSLIPYTFAETPPKESLQQPTLNGKALVQIWKYDSSSSSSIFGLVVILLGIIFVVARTVVCSMDMEEMKDATEILVTALKQIPKNSSHSRNSSSTPSLHPPATPPDMGLMDVTGDDDDDDDDDKKEFPVVFVSPVTSPNLSGGPPNVAATPKRVPYRRRISFHG